MKRNVYKKHESSFLRVDSRILMFTMYLSVFLIDLLPTLTYYGWVIPVAILYFEKKSLFAKYHSTQLFIAEVIKIMVSLLLMFISLIFRLPYYNSEQVSGYRIGVIGILDIILFILFLIVVVLGIVDVIKYRDSELPLLTNLTFKYMGKDPKYIDMQNSNMK